MKATRRGGKEGGRGWKEEGTEGCMHFLSTFRAVIMLLYIGFKV